MLQTTYLHSGWEFIQTKTEGKKIGYSQSEWLPAQVPGHVHLDLVSAGIIEDPFQKMHEAGCQWVDEVDWSYRTSFEWQPKSGCPKRVLRFEGLDTVATVFLNGEKVAEQDNMFVPLEVDVTSLLREGNNDLRVDFQSAVQVGRVRRDAYFASEGLPDTTPWFTERAFVRKAQYMSGWDWGPRLVSCGIWRPVTLVEYASRITDIAVTQVHHDDGSVQVTVKSVVEGPGELCFNIIDPDGEAIQAFWGDASVNIPDARKWTASDEPDLYKIEAVLFADDSEDAEDLDDRTVTLGLVDVKLLREADSYGESFEFQVNGRKIWARGANWIPDHSFPSIVSRQRYREQLERAKDMGFNMLRVWGGGLYETDEFYDLCDEMGILVWQDFPYGCSYYPDNVAAQAVARHEAEVNVVRLRNHPSLALWCGNNENLEMFVNAWGGMDIRPPRYYGEAIYDDVLSDVVKRLDPKTSYIETSPIGQPPADKAVVVGRQAGPSSGFYGDQHYWDAWHGRGDWKYYADSTGRFSSEYGFASSCSLATWRDGVGLDASADYHGPIARWHDKTGKGHETFVGFVELHYPESKDLADWTYYSQLNQRDALRFAVEHYRRADFCRGSLIWQLNDCWPVQSWAILDSNGHYKALAYELRRVYADTLLSITRKNEVVEVWAINDSEESISGEATLRATHLTTGEVLREWTEEFELAADSRKVVLTANVAGLPTPDVLLTTEWNDELGFQLLGEPKDARLPAAAPITISTSEDGFLLLKLDTPVVDLVLTENGSPEKFLDNYLTVTGPGIAYAQVSEVPNVIEARSLAGIHAVKMTRSPL